MKFNEPNSSPVLVFAVGGPIGSGCSFVSKELNHCLSSFGYDIETIDVTEVFLENIGQYLPQAIGLCCDPQVLSQSGKPATSAERIRSLQECGNQLRGQWGTEIIAALCVSEVIHPHIEKNEVLEKNKRQAYIIDSLKHPDEVRFLRSVFQEAFCMVGVVASDRTRKKRLQEQKDFDDDAFRDISRIDADEGKLEHGQKAIHAVTESDYFFANDYATRSEIQPEAGRLMSLIFGTEVQTPRKDEYGMQAAFKAAARSACLSRQIGAAILDKHGHILATGHNDVPCFGGGLYCTESEPDERCHSHGRKCYNDEHKQVIVNRLLNDLKKAGLLNDAGVDPSSIETIVRNSGIKNLIEFSRAVHAEMEAIIAVARNGTSGLVGSTLYCTTFPCHNCAKHIIDAGIAEVVYLEPYEKSLARELHSDSIYDPLDQQNGKKAVFRIYGGASPTRYDDYFRCKWQRKQSGRVLDRNDVRPTLLPIGAQNSDDLCSHVKQVTKRIKNVTERIGVEQTQTQGGMKP